MVCHPSTAACITAGEYPEENKIFLAIVSWTQTALSAS